MHEIEFLGHHVGRGGLRMMPDKVAAVQQWPQPKNAKELRSFLGLAGYYRRFVEGFSRIAAPLHDLTKTADGAPFVWTALAQEAFERLKTALRVAPVLALPDPDRQYVVDTDASDFATGAVLQQDHGRGLQPVAFMSHKMSEAETRYPTHDKEMLAIISMLGEWRTYLQGRQPFTIRIRTDHNSLQYFMTQQSHSARQARWLDKLADFDFKIEYIKGPTNTVADALSRRPDHEVGPTTVPPKTGTLAANALSVLNSIGRVTLTREELFSLPFFTPITAASLLASAERVVTRRQAARMRATESDAAASPPVPRRSGDQGADRARPTAADAVPPGPPAAGQGSEPISLELVEALRRAAGSDAAYQAVIVSLSESGAGPAGDSDLSVRSGMLFRQGRVVVPNDARLRTLLLREAHDARSSGHTGVAATKDRLASRVYWSGMSSDVHDYVVSCDSCQRNKVEQRRTAGLLRPPPVPDEPGYAINMDFVFGLPRTHRGHTGYLSMTCRLSNWLQVALCEETVTAEGAAELVFRSWVVHYGLPAVIISDRDPRFTGHFWRELWRLLDTQLHMSTGGHPQTDGKAENRQRTANTMLRHYVDFEQDDWDDKLVQATHAINHTKSVSTGLTPFEVMFRRAPRLPLDAALDPLRRAEGGRGDVPAASNFLDRHRYLWDAARSNLLKAQAEQKKQADRHRREERFAVGDDVLLSTRDLTLAADGVAGRPRAAKLTSRFVGPLKITRIINDNAYELQLPPQLRIHPVQNISKLRRYVHSPERFPGRPQPNSRPPPDLEDASAGEQYHVERILAQRGQNRRREYLVKWLGYPNEDCSWVARRDLNCPDLLAEYEDRQQAAAEPMGLRALMLSSMSESGSGSRALMKNTFLTTDTFSTTNAFLSTLSTGAPCHRRRHSAPPCAPPLELACLWRWSSQPTGSRPIEPGHSREDCQTTMMRDARRTGILVNNSPANSAHSEARRGRSHQGIRADPTRTTERSDDDDDTKPEDEHERHELPLLQFRLRSHRQAQGLKSPPTSARRSGSLVLSSLGWMRNAVAGPEKPDSTRGHDVLVDDTRMTMLRRTCAQGHTAADTTQGVTPTHKQVSTRVGQHAAQHNSCMDEEVPESADRLPRAPPHEDLDPSICERAQRASAPDEVLRPRWESLQQNSNYKTHNNNNTTPQQGD